MCTAVIFTDEAGHLFWGRNYDWSVTYGEKPVIMPKGFTIKCYFDSPVQAEHAAIGMAVDYHGYPLFFNCGNDAGLAVGGLNFAGYAQFAPGPVEGKTNIAAYEVPVWVAANFSTVDEVEAALEDTVIVDAQVGPDMPVVPLFSDCFSAATGTYYYNTVDDPALRCACLADYANADPSALVEPEVKLCRP